MSDHKWQCPTCGRSVVLCVQANEVAHQCARKARGAQKGAQGRLTRFQEVAP